MLINTKQKLKIYVIENKFNQIHKNLGIFNIFIYYYYIT